MKTIKDPLIVLPAYDFKGTMKAIVATIYQYKAQTNGWALHFDPDAYNDPLEYFEWLWGWTRSEIKYRPDTPLKEEIRTPSRTWYDRKKGVDCEDFTIFISTILLNNNIAHCLRVADYGSGWAHIYVVAYPNTKKEIIIDPVNSRFNVEKPFVAKKDYKIKPSGKGLHGIEVDGIKYPETCRGEAKIKYLTKYPPVTFKALSAYTGQREQYYLEVAKRALEDNTFYCAYQNEKGLYRSFQYEKEKWPDFMPVTIALIGVVGENIFVSHVSLEPLETVQEKSPKTKPSPPKPSGKFNVNQEIERLLESQTTFSEAQLQYLKNYSGSGGKAKDGATGEGLLYEFYTPDQIAALMWEIAVAHGYDGGNVLETSCGTGVFFDTAPDKEAKYVGFEINPYSAKIAQLRHPQANIYNLYFEMAFLDPIARYRSKFKGGLTWLAEYPFDIVIGNPPYGIYQNQYSPYFPELKKKGIRQIEMAFMYWSLQMLKPKGLMVYITSQNFMRTGIAYQSSKELLGEMAEFVDAYRLPSVFDSSQVPTDILVFRKK